MTVEPESPLQSLTIPTQADLNAILDADKTFREDWRAAAYVLGEVQSECGDYEVIWSESDNAILRWIADDVPGGRGVNLMRIHGPARTQHRNQIERETIPAQECHIHVITSRYWRMKPAQPDHFVRVPEVPFGPTRDDLLRALARLGNIRDHEQLTLLEHSEEEEGSDDQR